MIVFGGLYWGPLILGNYYSSLEFRVYKVYKGLGLILFRVYRVHRVGSLGFEGLYGLGFRVRLAWVPMHSVVESMVLGLMMRLEASVGNLKKAP